MNHIVIHDDHDGTSHCRRFDDVDGAAAYLEALHNDQKVDGARLFELHEVEFSVRSYVKVEIGGAGTDDASEVGAEPAPAPEHAPEHVPVDDVEYVDATMLQSDGADPVESAPVETAGGEPRRGLFGR